MTHPGIDDPASRIDRADHGERAVFGQRAAAATDGRLSRAFDVGRALRELA